MNVIPLQSGSKGNCYYLESESTKILIDAGISFRQAKLRLQSHDRQIQDVQHLFLTHDHRDHCRYVADFALRLAIPIHANSMTLYAAAKKNPRMRSAQLDCRQFKSGDSVSVGDFVVHTIKTPHDAAEGVAFIVEHDQKLLGILTDLGHAFEGLKNIMRSLDGVIIESNYDDRLLESGPYPQFLKNRIRGLGGHLSNSDSAKLLFHHGSANLQWACLCHLSDENNSHDTAIRTHQMWLGEDYPIYTARRHHVSNSLTLA